MIGDRLPRLDRDRMFLGDGGLETTMIFDEAIELPSSRRSCSCVTRAGVRRAAGF